MSVDRFTLDTNILVYSLDEQAGIRHRLAIEIVEASAPNCWLTRQAVSEFFSVVVRKNILSPAEAAYRASDLLELFPSSPPSIEAMRRAFEARARGRASYWDALLLATAAEAGCTAILTEDMRDGATVEGVRIVNPFGTDALSPTASAILQVPS